MQKNWIVFLIGHSLTSYKWRNRSVNSATSLWWDLLLRWATDLGISDATQPQPQTMRDDEDTWITTSTIAKQNNRDVSTQADLEMLEPAFSPKIYFRLTQLDISEKWNMQWTLEQLIKGQTNIIGDQQSKSRTRVKCNRFWHERYYSRG